MRAKIAPPLAQLFPDATIALLLAEGVDSIDPAAVAARVRELEVVALREAPDLLARDARISGWRNAYKAFGVDPHSYRPAHEALLKRLQRDAQLPRLSPLVDLYNAIAVVRVLPLGAYDADRVQGTLTLTRAEGGEQFLPQGEGAELEEVPTGEVIYRDEVTVLTRRWNHRDGAAAALGETTSRALFICEYPFADLPWTALDDALAMLEEELARVSEARIRRCLLHPDEPEVEFTVWPC